jgi:anti-anti-sigma factor
MEIKRNPGYTQITPLSQISMANIAKLTTEFNLAFIERNTIELNLKNVNFVSAAGMRLIINSLQESKKQNIPLSITNISAYVETVFKSTGLLETFTANIKTNRGKDMTITKNTTPELTTLTVEGRVDTTTAPELQTTLIKAIEETKNTILDFDSVAYVSSAGLRALLAGEKQSKKVGGEMKIINANKEVYEVFAMTGFSDILNIATK